MIDHEGKLSGSEVGWPEMENITRPDSPGRYRTVRISPSDIREDFDRAVRYRFDRTEARAVYRRRMRELVARVRQQREEKRRLGIDVMEAKGNRLSEQICDLDDRIARQTGPGRFNTLAAVTMIEVDYCDDLFSEDEAMVRNVLRTIAPYLSGTIAQDASELVELDSRGCANDSISPFLELGGLVTGGFRHVGVLKCVKQIDQLRSPALREVDPIKLMNLDREIAESRVIDP